MNMNQQVLANTSRAIADLDFTRENERIAELEADIEQKEGAILRANTRRDEISGTLRPLRYRTEGYVGHDGSAVADALLAELDPSEAAAQSKSVAELEEEREALRQGVIDLNSRIRDAQAEISNIRAGANRRAQDAVRPLLDALFADAQASARHVMEQFAAVQAIGAATKMSGPQMAALEHALGGVMGQCGLVPHERAIPVPSAIVGILSGLGGKGEALQPVLRTSIETQ